ncbi:hypothetical protein N0V82_007525 [Gnomoniopsis sp. IMI 355080]|nr:hypothetical protein N0V82_007525 [Gnomoniopsis sp. IMI 355080]
MMGEVTLDLGDLRTAVELILQAPENSTARKDPSDLLFPTLQRAGRLLEARESLLHISASGEVIGRRRPLIELVTRFYHFQSSDPRDKVYSLLGLATPDTVIDIDYNKTVEQVYLDFGKATVVANPSLDKMLPFMHFSDDDDRALPSWVPDWSLNTNASEKYGPINIDSLIGYFVEGQYNACGNLQTDVSFASLAPRRRRLSSPVRQNEHHRVPVGLLDNPVLHIGGIKLGVITDLSTRIVDGLVSRDALELAGVPFTGGLEGLRDLPSQRFQACWRTLVADRDVDGNPAPTRFGLALKHLFKRILDSRNLDTVEFLETEVDYNIRTFLQRVRAVTDGKRIFASKLNDLDENILGFVPRAARIGDTIAILFGTSVPLILRGSDMGQGNYMRIIGPAYVHGIMDGEVVSKLGEDRMEDSFDII